MTTETPDIRTTIIKIIKESSLKWCETEVEMANNLMQRSLETILSNIESPVRRQVDPVRLAVMNKTKHRYNTSSNIAL